ncbi:MAG: hypothetical protein KC897_00370 [Candidatus Omnitrophica bacterium]|nr:hypothetical protein [Candidatus Omnitrophota bacterium]
MRHFLPLFILLLAVNPAAAEDFAAEPVVAADEEMPDYDQLRAQLRDDYLQLKKEVEKDYTARINAMNPRPTDLTQQMKKQDLEREFRKRKQTILDDYQEQVTKLRDEEAARKGNLDNYYYEEAPPKEKAPKTTAKAKPDKVVEPAEETVRRGSRSIPPFEGKSELGNKPKFSSRGRAGGIVKSHERATQLRGNDDDDDDNGKAAKQPRNIGEARSMFERNRRK